MDRLNKSTDLIIMAGSWGGMSAVVEILSNLKDCCSIPVVIVLHRMRDTESELASLLSRKMNLIVEEIDEKMSIEKGKIYLAPADYHLLIETDFTFALDYSDPVNFSRPSIDVAFESAAAVYKDKLVAVLLTGANSDGAKGLKKVQELGGITIVQNPVEAQVQTMPNAALAIFKPTYILKKDQIRKFITELELYVQ
jgi:two-component system chemotaxis response regulator CheB